MSEWHLGQVADHKMANQPNQVTAHLHFEGSI